MRTESNAGAGGRRPSRRAVVTLALLALLALGYVLQLLGILLPSTALVIAGATLGILCEARLLRGQRGLARGLARAQLYHPVRQLLRDGLLLGGLAQLGVLRPAPAAAWLLVALLGCWATHFLCQGVAARVRRSRRLPIVTRNIDASALRLTPAPPALFGRYGAARLWGTTALVTGGMGVTAATGDARWGAWVGVMCWTVLLAGVVQLACRLLPGQRPAGEEEVLAWLDGWLAAYRPTVGMYFSGGTSSAYQANMWLSTLEGLSGRPVIVLRERFMVQRIDATDVPVLCIPRVAHLMRLEHSTLPVLLHPANSGKTSQVLRIPTIKHAFINHGESDKLSSCNPYAKAYDQVWVAGPAARERYRLADIGVADPDVVEVGRPQLTPIRPYAGPPAPGDRLTVLYAPTWEGWTDDPGNTSLALAGEAVVTALLADERVRLLYKPHPMTGSVDPAVKEADGRVRALIAEANERRAAAARSDARSRADSEAEASAVAEAEVELARRAAELTALSKPGRRRGGDEAERMLLQPAPVAPAPAPGPAAAAGPVPGPAPAQSGAAAVLEAVAGWEECYWRASPPWQHLVITGARPGIYTCFNQADLLVSDVSSVLSDYLSSEKPYAVVNTTGLPEEEFRAGFPTVRAATILTAAADGMAALLESVRDPSADTRRADRMELKAYLLGPDEPPSPVRFDRAVLDLRVEAEAHRVRCGAQLADGLDGRTDEPVRASAGADQVLLAEVLGEEEAL